jgi:hypothetical protein
MATVILACSMALAAAVLVAVLWSIVRALRTESANARLRRDGVRATGTVVDNTMSSTPQRRLMFSPVVEFRARTGESISAAALESAASSWPRGATVEVAYDSEDPTRFVLAGAPARGQLVANTIVGVLVVAVLVGSIVVMHRVWWQFRYDQGSPAPAGTRSMSLEPGS